MDDRANTHTTVDNALVLTSGRKLDTRVQARLDLCPSLSALMFVHGSRQGDLPKHSEPKGSDRTALPHSLLSSRQLWSVMRTMRPESSGPHREEQVWRKAHTQDVHPDHCPSRAGLPGEVFLQKRRQEPGGVPLPMQPVPPPASHGNRGRKSEPHAAPRRARRSSLTRSKDTTRCAPQRQGKLSRAPVLQVFTDTVAQLEVPVASQNECAPPAPV